MSFWKKIVGAEKPKADVGGLPDVTQGKDPPSPDSVAETTPLTTAPPAQALAASDQPAVTPWAVLSCSSCQQVYRLGDDAVAASLESALSLVSKAVVFSDGNPGEREDLVSTLEDVSPDAIQAARARATPELGNY